MMFVIVLIDKHYRKRSLAQKAANKVISIEMVSFLLELKNIFYY